MRPVRGNYRPLVAFVAMLMMLAMLQPSGVTARPNGRDNITIFLHGFNGRNCTQDWRDLMLNMRGAGFTGPFHVVKYLSSDSNCDLSGIANAQNASLFEFGSHTAVYGHSGATHDNNTDIRHLAWHLAHYIGELSPEDRSVDVVAHSMGGLIVRFALARQSVGAWPAMDVEDVITLGSPHGGVNFASWNGTVQGDQMEPGSFLIGWLRDHARNPQGIAGTEWTVMGSAGDVVVPRGTATDMDAPERIRFGWWPSPIGHGAYMHVGGSRASTVWNGTAYLQDYWTYGPMPMTRAALQYAGW